MEIDTIYNEDCIETMKRMPDNFIDLTVTSPPYDNLRKYNGYCFDFENVAKQLYRVMKEGGVVVWNVNDATVDGSETGTSFRQALYFMECGFNLHDTMIWQKNPIPCSPLNNRYTPAFEFMFVLSKGKPKTCNYIMEKCLLAGKKKANDYGQRKPNGDRLIERWDSNRTIHETKIKENIWYFPNNQESLGHPAPFPEQLAKDHIFSWSNEGDLVYDCFMGSGTTAKMAMTLNRHYIGSEISEEYCKIIDKRLLPLKTQYKLF